MKARRLVPFSITAALLLSLAAVAVACPGSTDLTLGDITDEQLRLMALSLPQLGSDYANFELDEDESGFQSNEDAIQNAFDPGDEGEDVQQFGRIDGYGETYSSLESLFRGDGVFLIGTTVSLYADAQGASGDLKDEVADTERQVGTTSEEVMLAAAEEFDPGKIGDESAGLFLTLSPATGAELTLHGTVVGFRQGRIIGSTFIVRFDDQDVQEEAAALARELDERILAVLRGEAETEPTPTPTETPAPTAGVLPSDVLESFHFRADVSIQADGGLALAAEGDFRAPNRLACTISGSLGNLSIGEDKLVVIGNEAWLDSGTGFRAMRADDPEVVDDLRLCPGSPVFWEGSNFLEDLDSLHGQPDAVNGIAAVRYALGEAATALGSIGFLPPELEGVTFNAFDLWLAQEGGWPVVVNMDVSGDAATFEQAFGLPLGAEADQQARMTFRVEIRDANNLDIRVEPPAP